MSRPRHALALLVCCAVFPLALPARQIPLDADWEADATLADRVTLTLPGLGAAQGVSLRDGKVYIYGDVYDADPRVGVIREYTPDLKPTGRAVCLRRDGKPLVVHPTGLTWDDKFGCFLGDTVLGKATIYQLDWEKALADGDLDRAVLAVIEDDIAVNGCRPVFVKAGGRTLLATADYGDVRPAVRLYDPEKLVAAGRSGAPGVLVHTILAGPFNQNLAWDGKTGQLTCVQNVVAGRGWRLDTFDLEKAVKDGRVSGPGVRVRQVTFPPHSELEGFQMLDGGRGIFVTAHPKDNVTVGTIRAVAPVPSPKGSAGFPGR